MLFWNKVYEGALGWTSELTKFGAQAVTCDPHRVVTFGGRPLAPASVESPYIIRVAIALLMVAASIEGRSMIRQRRRRSAAPIRASSRTSSPWEPTSAGKTRLERDRASGAG